MESFEYLGDRTVRFRFGHTTDPGVNKMLCWIVCSGFHMSGPWGLHGNLKVAYVDITADEFCIASFKDQLEFLKAKEGQQ